MVIVGVRLPCLRLAAALRHNLNPDAMAFLIERTGRRRVLESSDAAAWAGVRPGMALREATRLAPRAAVALDDPFRAAIAWRRLLDLLAVMPGAVEEGGVGLAFVRVPSGDRPERWFARVRGRLAPSGLAVRCAAASNPFVAYVGTHRVADAVCRPGGEATFVADAPLELLGLDDDVLLRLRLLGVTTLGELAALPRRTCGASGPTRCAGTRLRTATTSLRTAAGVW